MKNFWIPVLLKTTIAAAAGINFGMWQDNTYAGLFMIWFVCAMLLEK